MRCGHPFPLARLGLQLPGANRGQSIEACLTVVFGATSPFRRDRTGLLEAMECRIEGSLVHTEYVLRDLLDTLRDGPPVHRASGQGPKNQQVECALQEIELCVTHR